MQIINHGINLPWTPTHKEEAPSVFLAMPEHLLYQKNHKLGRNPSRMHPLSYPRLNEEEFSLKWRREKDSNSLALETQCNPPQIQIVESLG